MGKVNAVIPGYFGKENLRDLTGVQAEDEQMDKQDIAPALLGRIRADFLRLLRNAAPSAATYPAALDYADLVGGALAEAFRLHLSADTLPDGRMYWNIADRVLRPLLEEDHALVLTPLLPYSSSSTKRPVSVCWPSASRWMRTASTAS